MVRRAHDEMIGPLLRRWRESKGLTQREAAAAIGAHQGRWAKWETGKERPGPTYLRAIAKHSGGALSLETLVDASALGADGRAA
jgi:transcriptional regulator with XRE-family HTH domain